MKAVLGGTVIAEAPKEDLIAIEGNWYFPPESVNSELLEKSPTPYTCPWKGAAQYHDVSVGGTSHHDAAWSYPDPYPSSFDRVGKDYTGYVAFDQRQVTISSRKMLVSSRTAVSPSPPRTSAKSDSARSSPDFLAAVTG